MFRGRLNLFECDLCHNKEYVPKYPSGWMHFRHPSGHRGHACANCIGIVKGQPGQTIVYDMGHDVAKLGYDDLLTEGQVSKLKR